MLEKKSAEYDNEASSYDGSRFQSEFGQHLDHMHKTIIHDLLSSSGRLVLEAGIGTGRFALWLTGEGFKVTGVDVSREMLKEAKRKAHAEYRHLDLVLADIRFFPFREELFDTCLCVNVIDHLDLSGISKFLAEVKHTMKQDGSLVFNFSNIQSPYLPIAMTINLRKQALFRRGKIFSMWTTFREIDAALSENGFCVKETLGCMIASPVPLAEKLVKIVRIVNSAFEKSKLKTFCGSIFIKSQIREENNRNAN